MSAATLNTTALSMRRVLLAAALCLVGLAAFLTGRALAATADYNVNASGGYANTMTYANPVTEMVKGWHSAGTPYNFRLHRFSDGAGWGPWNFNDLNYHGIAASLPGAITAQIDNLGTANPAAYNVQMN